MTTTRILSIALLATATLAPLAALADVPVKVVRFDDIKPKGAVLNSTFEAIGLDPSERVYATLCNANEANGNCYLFRWNPKNGNRQYLGSFIKSAQLAGNLGPNKYWPKKEVFVKGHTHNVYLDGQMWMGSMNLHGYDNPSQHRGIHIFGFNLATGTLTDHAQWQPRGVFKAHSGMYALDAATEKNLLIGIGPVNCEIIIYDPATRAVTKVPGVPKEDNPQLSGRDMAVVGNKVIYQCGSAKTPISIYNLDTKENKTVDFPGTAILTLGYVPTRDGSTVYIADQNTVYALDTVAEKFTKVTAYDPNGKTRQVSPPALSLDEKKLYYVINQTEPNGGAYINDLYEYNMETKTRTKLMNLKSRLDGGAKVSGVKATASTGKIYFVFNSNKTGVLEVDVSKR